MVEMIGKQYFWNEIKRAKIQEQKLNVKYWISAVTSIFSCKYLVIYFIFENFWIIQLLLLLLKDQYSVYRNSVNV